MSVEMTQWLEEIKISYTLIEQYAMVLERLGEYIMNEPDDWNRNIDGTDRQDYSIRDRHKWESGKSMLILHLQWLAWLIRGGVQYTKDIPPVYIHEVNGNA